MNKICNKRLISMKGKKNISIDEIHTLRRDYDTTKYKYLLIK